VSDSGKAVSLDFGNGVKMELVLIPSGSFVMGAADGPADERPAHKVTITRPFYMGKYEVTQAQWGAVMGQKRNRFEGAQNPVDGVSWYDGQAFVKKLNEKFAASGGRFSLPTEAQWEYACRAGGTGKYSFGDAKEDFDPFAWFRNNSGRASHPVGQKTPNAWGLYDMHGNMWEWCADWYDKDYYQQSPTEDPPGPSSGRVPVLRGGGLNADARYGTATFRNRSTPYDRSMDEGIRVVYAR